MCTIPVISTQTIAAGRQTLVLHLAILTAKMIYFKCDQNMQRNNVRFVSGTATYIILMYNIGYCFAYVSMHFSYLGSSMFSPGNFITSLIVSKPHKLASDFTRATPTRQHNLKFTTRIAKGVVMLVDACNMA